MSKKKNRNRNRKPKAAEETISGAAEPVREVSAAGAEDGEKTEPSKPVDPDAAESAPEAEHGAEPCSAGDSEVAADAQSDESGGLPEAPFTGQEAEATPSEDQPALAENQEVEITAPQEKEPELPPELPPEMRFVKKRKKRRHIGFWTFVAFTFVFALASAAFVFLLFNFSGSTLFVSPDEVALPNFYGMDIAEVRGNPEYANFHFVVEEEFSQEYDEGVIYAQSPKAPKNVKENATVTLRVSKGVQEVEIPSVEGMTSEEAKVLLKEEGLAVVVRYQEDEEIEDGYAIRTDPEEGEKELAGNTITLYVSREDNYVRVNVPNCVGKSESSAKSTLQAAGFSVSVVEKESEKAAGTVISQSPTGTAIHGSNVTIIVSKGGLTMDGGDHTHELVATQVIPPSATGYGYTVYTCQICGLVTLGDQVPPTG